MDLGKTKDMEEMESLKHLPPRGHFLSTEVALHGRNEVTCPNTMARAKGRDGAQSLPSVAPYSLVYVHTPKPQLLHFVEGYIFLFVSICLIVVVGFCLVGFGWLVGFGRLSQLVSVEQFKANWLWPEVRPKTHLSYSPSPPLQMQLEGHMNKTNIQKYLLSRFTETHTLETSWVVGAKMGPASSIKCVFARWLEVFNNWIQNARLQLMYQYYKEISWSSAWR